jgi:hypothetical protein
MSEDSDFKNLIKTNNLEELINLHKNGNLTQEIIENNDFYLFRYSCLKGKLEICQWLYETFQITTEEALIYLIKTNNLEELINLHKNENLTQEIIEHNDFYLFRYSCLKGKLEICQWLYKTFQITREKALICNNDAFNVACEKGHLNVCQWLHETFQITKEEVVLNNNYAFWFACSNNHYHIISFLCNTFVIIEEDVKDIIEKYFQKKQEKILDCLTPFGSFTKPVKK